MWDRDYLLSLPADILLNYQSLVDGDVPGVKNKENPFSLGALFGFGYEYFSVLSLRL